MKAVLEHIEAKQANFAKHPFFAELRLDRPIEQIASFAPRLAFWVMSFQDILRLNEQMVVDPTLKRIARHHRDEDLGHERWFLEDIAKLTGGPLTISALYGRASASTRDAAYQLITEVYRATDDRLRIVLVLVLESTGHVFFGRTAVLTNAATQSPQKLKYFSDFHLHIEQAHEVFESEIERQILSIPMPPSLEAEALSLVDRAYSAFDAMFHGLRDELAQRREKPAGVQAPEASGPVLAAPPPVLAAETKEQGGDSAEKSEVPWPEVATL
ncbi:hypothetical protein [Hyalangium versicolor]|uniref:hypothetical protein n=1 Tax=Hyalangium versicolor TaxID=2861190 RepID=UPI001CCA5F5B|nr:hypothetical protein [Hyalangium versicolor]